MQNRVRVADWVFVVLCRTAWAVDYFWSGAWWWQLTHRRTFEQADVRSEQPTSQPTYELNMRPIVGEAVGEVFAWKYWGNPPPPVREVVVAARKAGVRLGDLRLLVLCGEIQQVGTLIYVARTPFARLLGWAALLALPLYSLHWLGMLQRIWATAAPACAKVVVGMLVTVIYLAVWRGFSLYLYRANRARRRSGPKVAAIARRMWIQTAQVVDLTSVR